MKPFERALLHIGAPKTGTTTIQNLLRRNRAALLDRGFHVPRAGQAGTGQHIDPPAIVLAGESRADLDRHFDIHDLPRAERRARFIADLDQEIAAAPASHTLLLSSEHMFYSAPSEIPVYRALLARYARRFECVMYLRRQDRWLGSLSIQIRKTDPAWRLTLDSSLADDYGRRVRAWDAGADACHIRRFETPFLEGGDLLTDFAHTIGLLPGGLAIGEPRANPSLRQEQLELMDALNRRLAPLPAARRVHLRQGFAPLCDRVAGGTTITFPRRAAEGAFAAFEETNAWLGRTRDPAGPSLFFDDDFEDCPETPGPPARYDGRALRAIAGEIARLGGPRTPAGPLPTDRAGLIDRIVTAYIALRRAAS